MAEKITDVDIDITIDVENDAFERNINTEIKRILRNTIEAINFKENRNHNLRDINGNHVGNVKVTIYKE